jgi:hypothetical protein
MNYIDNDLCTLPPANSIFTCKNNATSYKPNRCPLRLWWIRLTGTLLHYEYLVMNQMAQSLKVHKITTQHTVKQKFYMKVEKNANWG